MIDLKKMSILVVDDMKSMRLTIRKMLRHLELGTAVKTAADCKEARAILRSHPIDLVILDWRMPDMSGSDLLEHIRNDEALKYLPVIMVTAEAERDIVMEVAEIQVDGYLLKPLNLKSLDNKIRTVVEKANNPDEATLYFRKAKELEKSGDFQEAIKHIKLALKQRPHASRLLRMLGLLHLKTGEQTVAEQVFKKAIVVNRHDAVTRHVLGEMYHAKGELLKAAQYYLDVLSLTIKYLEKSIKLGEELLKRGQNSTAVRLFSKGISRMDRNLPMKERVIDLCMENGEFDYARKLLENMVKEFPSKFNLVLKAGYSCMATDDYDSALEYFLSVDKHQGHLIEPKLEIARIFLERNQIYKADEYINKVLQKDPGNEEALALRKGV